MLLTNIKLHINPIYHLEPPSVLVKMDNNTLHSGELREDSILEFSGLLSADKHKITIELLNKKDSDCYDGHDKAVVIDSISFFNVTSIYTLLNSTYAPQYSKAYLKSQLEMNIIPDDVLHACNYLGWNGKWTTCFSVPIFAWLHRVENLGWVYSP
jgi:hypothetical protein